MAAVGDQFGRFTLLEELGEGYAARVYRAQEIGGWFQAAIKVLKPDRRDPETLARFFREFRIMANISHPNVIRVIELFDGTTGTEPAIVMDLVPDRMTLLEAIQTLGTTERVSSLLLQSLYALHAMHEVDPASAAIHRDLSPNNLLVALSGTGQLRVTDFGFSKLEADPTFTNPGVWFGTQGCIAPEQYTDAAHVDIRADLYALGRSFAAAIQNRLPVHAEPHLIPAPIGNVLVRLTQVDRDNRPATPSDAISLVLTELSAAGILPTDIPYHSARIERDVSWTEWTGLLGPFFGVANYTSEHLEISYQLQNPYLLLSVVDRYVLFDRLDAGPVEAEYGGGNAVFERCDPLATLYEKLYPLLSSDRRLRLYNRLRTVGERYNRFYVQRVARRLLANERDEAIRQHMVAT